METSSPRVTKGLHVFVFVWLVSCCVADWTPVKNIAEKAAEAQQVIQEQLHNYHKYMVSQTLSYMAIILVLHALNSLDNCVIL